MLRGEDTNALSWWWDTHYCVKTELIFGFFLLALGIIVLIWGYASWKKIVIAVGWTLAVISFIILVYYGCYPHCYI